MTILTYGQIVFIFLLGGVVGVIIGGFIAAIALGYDYLDTIKKAKNGKKK